MKIDLPLETWTEIFGFVPRSQLKQLVPHIGDETRKRDSQGRKCQQTIGDRQFVSFVQFFLHKCGEVTLGLLMIYTLADDNEPMITILNGPDRELPLADVPISENVKSFQLIRISNNDEPVIAFLQEFQRNSLLTNVNLHLDDCSDFLFEILTNFVPLFTNINSINIDNGYKSTVLDKLQSEYSELAITFAMFTSARVLLANYNCRDIWFCDWLHIPRDDGKPRVLFLERGNSFSHFNFIKHIKKDFLAANQAISFFINLEYFRDEPSHEFLTLKNGQTQEKLCATTDN